MKVVLLSLALILLCACQSSSVATSYQPSEQVTAGFSQQRLKRIDKVMQQYIDQGKLSGIMTLVAKDGKIVHQTVQGMQDREAGIPLAENSLFRIYSMTKPITVVAAMSLWEQGLFHMQDPVANYLPELKNLKVYVSGEGDNIILEDARSPIRIIDLFTHTAGFSYGFTGSEVDKVYRASAVMRGDVPRDKVLAEIAKLPLNNQPGTAWNYGISIDILGFLVEKLTGKKLGEVMQDVIFDPLQMTDTGFYVKPANVSRFTQVYSADKTGKTIVMENEPLGDFLTDPAIHNGGGGLISSTYDYFKFAQMLLNGGELNGVRILGRKTVEYLSDNHLPHELIPFEDGAGGEGFALGMSVMIDPEQSMRMSSVGNYGWGGMASTYFRIDPKERLVIIGMTQFIPSSFHRYSEDLQNLVYQALVE